MRKPVVLAAKRGRDPGRVFSTQGCADERAAEHGHILDGAWQPPGAHSFVGHVVGSLCALTVTCRCTVRFDLFIWHSWQQSGFRPNCELMFEGCERRTRAITVGSASRLSDRLCKWPWPMDWIHCRPSIQTQRPCGATSARGGRLFYVPVYRPTSAAVKTPNPPWTDETMIQALKDWAAEHGRAPSGMSGCVLGQEGQPQGQSQSTSEAGQQHSSQLDYFDR